MVVKRTSPSRSDPAWKRFAVTVSNGCAMKPSSKAACSPLEDLAHRLLNCGERTLCRDLAVLRKHHVLLPLRSQIKDMGRSLSHRSTIVRLWLGGKEYSEIARTSCHSVAAVQNYVDKFK